MYFISKDYSDLNLKASGDGLMVPLNRLDCNRLWKRGSQKAHFYSGYIFPEDNISCLLLILYFFTNPLQDKNQTKTKYKTQFAP